ASSQIIVCRSRTGPAGGLRLGTRGQDRGLEPEPDLRRGEGRAQCRRLRKGGAVVREARRPRRRHAAGSASAARESLRAVQGGRTGAGDLHARPLHEVASRQPCVRLRAVPQGAGELQRQPGPVLIPFAPGPFGARPEGGQGVVRGVQGAGGALPGLALRARFALAHDVHRQLAGPVRGARRPLLLHPRCLRGRHQQGAIGAGRLPGRARAGGSAVHPGSFLRRTGDGAAARRQPPRAGEVVPAERIPEPRSPQHQPITLVEVLV
ncbi:MAG: Outer membrane beta-barrel assembly protein BamD, partial [uncultured Ramlibacter sp.]